MPAADLHDTIEAVWRIESAQLIARLSRLLRDVGLAEEVSQDALVAALEQWPSAGVPKNPGAWLMATAKRRAIDRIRRNKLWESRQEDLARDWERQQHEASSEVFGADEAIPDDLLRLMFTACHPVLSTEARLALTLRLLGGLTTAEIARSFLVSEATIAQRIVRAKRTLVEKQVEFEAPPPAEMPLRLASVTEVIYLLFNEGYTATAGDDWMRPALCEEALRLGRILAELLPQESEVHGLVALMEIQASRLRARVDAKGEPILLMQQKRARWDQLLIRRGLAALRRASGLSAERGPYQLQAEIAACHAQATTAESTDWQRIADLYAELGTISPSPVVELNRAVAVAMAQGPEAGLQIVDTLTGDPRLASYHLLPSVRADLLMKIGRLQEAAQEFERAASLTQNARERALLDQRAAECRQQPDR
jgi:RNA polymerase sigma factor (sigma-70 family)